MLQPFEECYCHCQWHNGCWKKSTRAQSSSYNLTGDSEKMQCLVINYNKLQYKKTEVNFFGETYTIDGCKPAQTKLSAITTMPELSCKKEVQSFIGMINYLSKFPARLSELSESIRELSKERVPFNWGPEYREAFNVIKKELVKAPILAYYNPNKETVLQTDTSIKGLSACLLQQGKPLYFTSEALTDTPKDMWQLN